MTALVHIKAFTYVWSMKPVCSGSQYWFTHYAPPFTYTELEREVSKKRKLPINDRGFIQPCCYCWSESFHINRDFQVNKERCKNICHFHIPLGKLLLTLLLLLLSFRTFFSHSFLVLTTNYIGPNLGSARWRKEAEAISLCLMVKKSLFFR